jgi:hypothetical protein
VGLAFLVELDSPRPRAARGRRVTRASGTSEIGRPLTMTNPLGWLAADPSCRRFFRQFAGRSSDAHSWSGRVAEGRAGAAEAQAMPGADARSAAPGRVAPVGGGGDPARAPQGS